VPSVDAGLLSSALFLFREYLQQTAADNPVADDDEEAHAFDIDTKAVLDLFADELGTNVQTTLALYLRVTALYRLLAQSPTLAELAVAPDEDGVFNENAMVAAARLDVAVSQKGEERTADFDARQFREALDG
jgi:hypothetical protein